MTDTRVQGPAREAPWVTESPLPTAVIEFAHPDGTPAGLPVVEAGQAFGLSAAASSGVAPATIVSYVWTLLPD